MYISCHFNLTEKKIAGKEQIRQLPFPLASSCLVKEAVTGKLISNILSGLECQWTYGWELVTHQAGVEVYEVVHVCGGSVEIGSCSIVYSISGQI